MTAHDDYNFTMMIAQWPLELSGYICIYGVGCNISRNIFGQIVVRSQWLLQDAHYVWRRGALFHCKDPCA